MEKYKFWAVVILILAFGAVTFYAGRKSVNCPVLETVSIETTIDTLKTIKKADLTWTNDQLKSPVQKKKIFQWESPSRIGNEDTSTYEDTSTQFDLKLIRDSVANETVGLTFEHLVRGDIVKSDYKIYYPELTINKVSLISRVLKKTQGWQVGTMISVATLPQTPYVIDAGILLGYRYEKLSILGGYTYPSRRVMVMAIREF